MSIGVNSISNISFSAKQLDNGKVTNPKEKAPQPSVNAPLVQNKNEYKGFNGFVAKCANFYLNTTTVTGGVFKGIFDGLAVGTGIAAVNTIYRACFVENVKFLDALMHPTRALGKIGKVVAPIVATLVMGVDIVSSVLRANKKTADVDHELRTGHRS